MITTMVIRPPVGTEKCSLGARRRSYSMAEMAVHNPTLIFFM